jgi:hypothetical protein
VTEPLPDTWHNRDLPVLRAIVRAFQDDPTGHVRSGALATELGMEPDDVTRALANLLRGGFVVPPGNAGRQAAEFGIIIDITDRALYATGSWPTPDTALDRIVATLQAIADNTDADEDTRSRARKILDSLTGAGKQIGISVATAAITGQIPGA